MDPRFVAIGAVFTTEQRLARVARGVARGAAGAARSAVAPAVTVAVAVTPASARRSISDAVRLLDEQGRAAATSSAEDAGRVVEALADRLSREPALLHFVDRMVDHLQWRVIDAVLPVVLERLAAEPDQLREIVEGQSRGMADELAQAARSRAVAGDEAVDRFLTRVFRRRTVRDGPAARNGDGAAVVPAGGNIPPADGEDAGP